MLTNGTGKMVATSTAQISDDFKAVFTDYEETNPEGYDTGSIEDIIASGAQVVYGPKSALTNLAAEYSSETKSGNGSMESVSAEQIVAWNPDYIVAYSQQAADTIKSDAALVGVTAVKEDHVLVCPKALYLWAVRSSEGCLFPIWLGSTVYPEAYGDDFSMTEELQDFYSDWYGNDLSDEDAEAILSGATNAQAQNPMAGRGKSK